MYRFIEKGSITSTPGFKAAGIFCGIKKKKKDLALIYSKLPSIAAGTFTLNKVKAAPLLLTQEVIRKDNNVKAVIINSGNANACTGETGDIDAKEIQSFCAHKLGILPGEVLVASTGVIGKALPMTNLLNGINSIIPLLSEQGGTDAAEAIMTTDMKIKSFAIKIELKDKQITLGSISKGSGMIAPNMATMLAFISTDAKIEKNLLQDILSEAVEQSFNKISVDGETSTNDMVILLANSASGIEIKKDSPEYFEFKNALNELCIIMAKSIVSDGEGATKLVTIKVTGAASETDANLVGKSISNSALVKTALYGSDANWGRIISAAGHSGADLIPEKVSISFNEFPILHQNFKVNLDEKKVSKILSNPEFTIKIDLGIGNDESIWWTCDFSEEYIRINSDYRT